MNEPKKYFAKKIDGILTIIFCTSIDTAKAEFAAHELEKDFVCEIPDASTLTPAQQAEVYENELLLAKMQLNAKIAGDSVAGKVEDYIAVGKAESAE